MWHSLHGYIHDYKALDHYISHYFEPFVSGFRDHIKKFFYIRYWLGGPHIRFRFICHTPEDFAEIRRGFEQSISNCLNEIEVELIDYDSYYTDTMLEAEGITEVYWCEHGSVKDIPYLPEYERYGGVELMGCSEDIFCESSHMTCLLNRLDFRRRILAGVDLTYLSLRLYAEDPQVYKHYAKLWELYTLHQRMELNPSVIRSRIHQLRTRDSEPSIYSGYLDLLRQSLKQHRNYSILCSHIHMTNNRLGIHPEVEHAISSSLYESCLNGEVLL